MKKIVKPNGEIRLDGYAEADGIAISAFHPTDPFGFLKSKILATVDKEGKIDCSFGIASNPNINLKINTLSRIVFRTLIILIIITFISAIVVSTLLPTWVSEALISVAFIFMAGCWLTKPISIFFAKLFGDEEMKSFSKFLSAKNSILNAYYDLHQVPTIEEAKQYSTYEPESKYIQDTYLATFFLSIAVLHLLSSWVYFVVVLLSSFIIWKLSNKKMLFFWQFLIVSKPEDIHYEAAITALKECLEFRNSVMVGFISLKLPSDFIPDFSEERCAGCENYDFCKGIIESAKAETTENPVVIKDGDIP